MPSRSLLLAALGLLTLPLLPACSRNEITPESLVPPQPVSSSKPAPVPQPSSPPPLQRADEAPLPAPVLLEVANDEQTSIPIGTKCTAGVHCGTKGRVAVRAFFQGFGPHRPSTPCKLARLSPPGPSQHMEIEEPSACVEGGRLYVENRCVMCRIDRRTSIEAEIAELTPQQLSNLQKVVAYTGEPLRTAAAWQVALADAPKKPRSAPN